jgi:hypothetical protein
VIGPELARLLVEAGHGGFESGHAPTACRQRRADRPRDNRFADLCVGARYEDAAQVRPA